MTILYGYLAFKNGETFTTCGESDEFEQVLKIWSKNNPVVSLTSNGVSEEEANISVQQDTEQVTYETPEKVNIWLEFENWLEFETGNSIHDHDWDLLQKKRIDQCFNKWGSEWHKWSRGNLYSYALRFNCPPLFDKTKNTIITWIEKNIKQDGIY